MKRLPKKVDLDFAVEHVQAKILKALGKKSDLPREKFSGRDPSSLGIRPQYGAREENIQRRTAFILEKKGDPQTDPDATVLVFTPEGLYRCRYIFTESIEGGYLPDWQRREECAKDLLLTHADTILALIKKYKHKERKVILKEDTMEHYPTEFLPAEDASADATDTQAETLSE